MNSQPWPHRVAYSLTLSTTLLLAACEQESSAPTGAQLTPAPTIEQVSMKPKALAEGSMALFDAGDGALITAVLEAKNLQSVISAFLADPTQSKLSEAQQQWFKTAFAYRKFYFQRQIAISEPEVFAGLNKADFRIGTYPIQPGFIDAFGDYKYSGIVFDSGFELSKESLGNQHGLTDVSEVVLGIYPIEFLLFNIGNARAVEDFIPQNSLTDADKEQGFQSTDELPNNRRRQVLQLQSEILVDDLEALKHRWQTTESAPIKEAWVALPGERQVLIARHTLIAAITGLLVEIGDINTEDAGERELSIPPEIQHAEFAQQQRYIANALGTLTLGMHYVEEGKRAKAEDLLGETISLFAQESVEDQKAFWQEAFAKLKSLADLLNGLDKKKPAAATAEKTEEGADKPKDKE